MHFTCSSCCPQLSWFFFRNQPVSNQEQQNKSRSKAQQRGRAVWYRMADLYWRNLWCEWRARLFYYLAVPLLPINTSCQSPTALKLSLCTVYRGLCQFTQTDRHKPNISQHFSHALRNLLLPPVHQRRHPDVLLSHRCVLALEIHPHYATISVR